MDGGCRDGRGDWLVSRYRPTPTHCGGEGTAGGGEAGSCPPAEATSAEVLLRRKEDPATGLGCLRRAVWEVSSRLDVQPVPRRCPSRHRVAHREALGLRHEDLDIAGPQVAVIAQVNDNPAHAKGGRPRWVPSSSVLMRLYVDLPHRQIRLVGPCTSRRGAIA